MEAVRNAFNFFHEHIQHKDYSLIFFVALIGLLYLLKYFWWLVSTLFQSLCCKLLSFVYKPNLRKYGKWAVVTGSTDGIGKAYAIELAKRNMNIVLVSRSIQKLKDTANEIRKQTDVEVKVIQADFTHGLHVYENIERELKDIDVGILVNNVGMAPPHPTFRKLDDIDRLMLYNEVIVNNGAPSQMTRLILPNMKQRKRGMIVFVGSIVQTLHIPYFTDYSATKAFVSHFAGCLEHEISHHNIDTHVLLPSIVDTNLSKGDHIMGNMSSGMFRSITYPTASTYASWAICSLGVCKISNGYWFFDLTQWFIHTLKAFCAVRVVGVFLLKFVYGKKVIN